MELDPEVHSHPHKSGHRWIDMALASTALLVSIASIIIAIQNESNMRRLVTANSWPYIALNHGNEKNGEAIIHFDVRNAGIGPATLEKLVVTYDGNAVGTTVELLKRCCGSAGGVDAIHRVSIDVIQGRVFVPREETSFFSVRKSDADGPIWEKLNVERFKLGMSACYSSVFGEHWITRLGKPNPVTVNSCDALNGPAYDANLNAQGS
jgi:hypothetical protein